jgi:hypothetical protein
MYSFIGLGINCGTQLFINWGGGGTFSSSNNRSVRQITLEP